MPENYEHYITKNIKAVYKSRLSAPAIYLVILFFIWHLFSLSALLSPDELNSQTTLEETYKSDSEYVTATVYDLNFTGYTQDIFGFTVGYYYYTMRGDECIIVLLSPDTSEEGLPFIEKADLTGKIINNPDSFATLLKNLSTDLNWTENGIQNKVSHYVLSEPGYNIIGNTILFAVYIATGGYALICLVLSVNIET